MNAKLILSFLTIAMLAIVGLGHAQQPTKVPRIGYLGFSSPSTIPTRIEAFRQGLRELGYVEGKNIFIEWRSAEGNADRLPSLAAELVRLKVDIIVTNGPYSTRAAKAATVNIPIVMAAVGDPVGDGIVASLARPGGNITGLSSVAPELSGKRLELLKEIVPKLSRVAVFGSSTSPNTAGALREVELAAGAFKVKVQYLDVLSPKDIETAFRAAVKGRADAMLWQVAAGVANAHRTQILELAVKSRLPAIYASAKNRGSRWAYELRRERFGLGPARRHLRGQDFERRQASRSSRGAADKV